MFEKFYKKFGEIDTHYLIDMDNLKIDKSLFIPEIFELLKKDGVSSYGDKFIWTLNPDDYYEWLNDYLRLESKVVPFGRTAFGDIFFIKDGEVMILINGYGYIDYTTSRVDWFFNRYLTDNAYLDKYFKKSNFNQLANKNNLTHDTCFGYVPLLALGGSEELENLQLVKMKEHLLLNSQAIGQAQFYPF